MPIYRATHYTRTFVFTDEAGAPVNITGWEFRAMFRAGKDVEANPVLLELTTDNMGFVVTNGPGGLLLMDLTPDDTDAPLEGIGKVYFDVLREDDPGGPIWLFEGNVPVKVPVTFDG